MIYTHVLNRGGGGVQSPLDAVQRLTLARTLQLEAQMAFHRRPLVFDETEYDRVTVGSIWCDLV